MPQGLLNELIHSTHSSTKYKMKAENLSVNLKSNDAIVTERWNVSWFLGEQKFLFIKKKCISKSGLKYVCYR